MSDEATPQAPPEQTLLDVVPPKREKWYTPLTRVTPLSRVLAAVLFVVLPFVGFWLGKVATHESYSEQSVVSGNDTQAFNSESIDQTTKEVYGVKVSEQVIVISKSDGTLVKEITPRDVPPQSTGTSKGGPGTLDNPERTYEFRPLNVEQESIIDSSRGRVYFRVTNTENIAPMSLKDMLYVYDITSGTTSLVIPPVFQLNILATGIAPDLRYVAYTEYHSVTVYDLVTARQVTSIDEPDTLGDDTGMQVKIKGWPNSSTLEYEIYHITPIVNTGYKKLVSEDSVFTLADTKRIDVTTLNSPGTTNVGDMEQSLQYEEYSGTFSTELIVDGERYQVALVADNLVTEQADRSFCGYDKGVLTKTGTFRLVSRKDGREVGSIALDNARLFADGQMHDGIRLIEEPKIGAKLIGIYQYESCNTESLTLYLLARNGDLTPVPFVQEKDGSAVYEIGTSHEGIEHVPEGLRACTYSNATFTTFCSTYNFTGSAMQRTHYDIYSETNMSDTSSGRP